MACDEEQPMTSERLAEIREQVDNIGRRGRYSGAVTPSEVIYHEDVRSLLAELDRLRAREADLLRIIADHQRHSEERAKDVPDGA